MKKFVSILFVIVLFIPFVGAKSFDDFDNNFGYRDRLVYVNAVMNFRMLASSQNKEIVVGNDGFLFLSAEFQNPLMTDEEINQVADKIVALEKRLQEKGITTIFVIAPDKKTIYSEYVPARLEGMLTQNYDNIKAALVEKKAPFIDLKSYFLAMKDKEILYSKDDTHWNRYGALLAYQKILLADLASKKETDQHDLSKMEEVKKITSNLKTQPYERNGDLARMVGIGGSESTLEVPYAPIGEKKNNVFIYADSFGEGLFPFFQKDYRSVASIHVLSECPFNFDKEGIDTVVIEIVERDLYHLTDDRCDIPSNTGAL